MTVGERIKERRLEREMTLKQLGDKIGVSEGTVQRYESGIVRKISPESLKRIAQALDTSVRWLLGEPEETASNSASIEVSQTERMLLTMYRNFTPEQKSTVRSMILTINTLSVKEIGTSKELEFAEDFIDSTEYASDYRKEKEHEFGNDND